MKAVQLHGYGGVDQLVYEEVPIPVAGAGEVLVKLSSASVNPIDWKVRSGARQKDFPQVMPAILGRDVSGIVQAVGSSVHNFKVGDRVEKNTVVCIIEAMKVMNEIKANVTY